MWLIEELLDSQTVPGCRKIFDYLESRRKRIISKNFSGKKLVILRMCNELLRRLSRAEDTAFSGRVFIFLFQSLPPGDKSSVNLRGEYHTQNVTTYDQVTLRSEDAEDKMDVDSEVPAAKQEGANDQTQSKTVSFSEKKDTPAEKSLDADALYPIFWSLQDSFNQPKKLFEPANLAHFKSGMEATMTAFKANPPSNEAKSSKQNDDKQRGQKRKLDSEDDDVLTSFNPKYLTSRDLFELEASSLECPPVMHQLTPHRRSAICLSDATFWFKLSSSWIFCYLFHQRPRKSWLQSRLSTSPWPTWTKSSARMMPNGSRA